MVKRTTHSRLPVRINDDNFALEVSLRSESCVVPMLPHRPVNAKVRNVTTSIVASAQTSTENHTWRGVKIFNYSNNKKIPQQHFHPYLVGQLLVIWDEVEPSPGR
jgi:hypothetical protein